MSQGIRIKHETLYRKTAYLSAELEEASFAFEGYKKEFLKEVSKVKEESPASSLEGASKRLADSLKTIDDKDIELNHKAQSKELKELYRKIMLKTHPDKLVLMQDKERKEVYNNACSTAMRAMEEGSWYLLLSAAKQVDINDFKVTAKNIEMLHKECNSISNEIKRIKDTIPWIWFHSNEDQRKKCLDYFIEKRSKS